MLYKTPVKGDDGLYFVKAVNDSMQKCLVQLNKVKIVDVSGDLIFELNTESNMSKIQTIDEQNLAAAHENCESWFGKQLSENVIRSAYTSSVIDGQLTGECIEVTKVFNSQQEEIGFENVQVNKTCDIILEFSGLWFAKKSFGSSWNIVQVRVHPDPVVDTYPEKYAFVDEDDQ